MIVVPDVGQLVYLVGAGQLELLRRLYLDVVVPRVVFEEVAIAGEGLTGSAELAAASRIRVVDRDSDPGLAVRLHRGEAAAIPLALELGAVLLVDDGAARLVATELGCRPAPRSERLRPLATPRNPDVKRLSMAGGRV